MKLFCSDGALLYSTPKLMRQRWRRYNLFNHSLLNSVKSSGKGTVAIGEEISREESQPSVELGLGIGPNFSARNPRSRKTTELGFTRVQLTELYEQTLVSKFIAAPLPFPLQLAPPISEGNSSVGIKDEALVSERMMDPELNRCRRTDGKKWRCRKTVIPNQKYCESHMHRGRQRSRKPVELPNKETPSRITVSGNSIVSNEIPLGLPLVTDSSNCSKRAVDGFSGKSKSIPEATVTCANVVGGASGTSLNFSSSKDNGFVSMVEEKPKVQRCSTGGHMSTKRDAIAMLGCSPTSVLQGGNRSGSSGVEQWRCKRNDGKRWRCSRQVLANQKYCERHIHRVVTKLPADVDSSKLNNTNRLSVSSVTQLDKGKSGSSSSDTTLTDSALAAHPEDRSDASSS